jgi:hypothetical protein
MEEDDSLNRLIVLCNEGAKQAVHVVMDKMLEWLGKKVALGTEVGGACH